MAWTNTDFSSVRSGDIHPRATLPEIPQTTITQKFLKITYLDFHSNFPGAIGLSDHLCWPSDGNLHAIVFCWKIRSHPSLFRIILGCNYRSCIYWWYNNSVCFISRISTGQLIWDPFYQYGWTLIPTWVSSYISIMKYGMILLMHSQASTTQQLRFEYK